MLLRDEKKEKKGESKKGNGRSVREGVNKKKYVFVADMSGNRGGSTTRIVFLVMEKKMQNVLNFLVYFGIFPQRNLTF